MLWKVILADVQCDQCGMLAFEQKRFPFGLRQRIGEAISKIQSGGMAARFAKVAIGLTRYASLRFGDRLNRDFV